MATDHRSRPRRRGEALQAAILQAALDELAEVGYAQLTMERVAERAGASKASVYRRWGSRLELAAAVLHHVMPEPDTPPDTGSLRGDLLALFRGVAALLSGAAGEALRGLLGDTLHDAERTGLLRRHPGGAGRAALTEITRRAVARGEIDAAVVTPRRLETGPALLRYHFLFGRGAIPDRTIVEIVDEVVLPLLGHPGAGVDAPP